MHGHHDVPYFKIYVALIILFLISVAGPEVGEATGLRWITLITAFGIALVKARLVINNFMHLKWEKRLMKWMLTASLIMLGIMMAGVAPDVMNHEGNNLGEPRGAGCRGAWAGAMITARKVPSALRSLRLSQSASALRLPSE